MSGSSGAKVAVLDDERGMVEIVSMVLRRAGHEVVGFSDPVACLEALEHTPVDLLLTDLRMPGLDGVAVLQRVKRFAPTMPVVLFTAHASVPTAIEAIRSGAYDYIQKPFDNHDLRALVHRALEHARLASENRYLRAHGTPVVSESPSMKRVMALVRRVAPSRSTVLITGESGTGKEVVARAVHGHSDRRDGPFVALNCKAISENLLESELFGHVRGAFTGAHTDKPGVFVQADGGTLFLDEIGETGAAFQTKLLRVLQEREVLPVGGHETRAVDLRVVAATNRDLAAEVQSGRFREDLYFRLAVIPLVLSPLRERTEDILPLAHAFLRRHEHETSRRLGWTADAEAYLLSHRWPGNVRELSNAVERAALLADGPRIGREDLSLQATEPGDSPTRTLAELVDAVTREHVRHVLDEVDGRRAEAARQLGIDRTTLYRLMRKHGL